MPSPSGTQRHIPVSVLSASTCKVYNTRLGSHLLRGGLPLDYCHGTWDGAVSVEHLGRAEMFPHLGFCNITTFRPVISLFLSALPEVFLECFALPWARNLWHRGPIDRLQRFWFLEGTQHREDRFPILNCPYGARGIRTTISNPVHVVTD